MNAHDGGVDLAGDGADPRQFIELLLSADIFKGKGNVARQSGEQIYFVGVEEISLACEQREISYDGTLHQQRQ